MIAQPGGDRAVGCGRLRASHADRERVIGVLETAFAHGLLTKGQFDVGVDQTLASQTYADLTAAIAGLQVPGARPKPLTRPANAAAFGACGLILTAFLTVVIVPSATTLGMVATTAGVIYAALWLLAAIMMLAARPAPSLRPWPRR
jgi:Domain of unknown function (DUF1707)